MPRFRSTLGYALMNQGKSVQAEAAYREAIRLKPDAASDHCNLGMLIAEAGRYAEALEELRRGHELGSRQPGWPYPSAEWVRETERLASLAVRLPAFLNGDDRPRDAAERLALAQVCNGTKRYVAAVRFWGEALEADPKLGEDRQPEHRYNAARAAALAGAGMGQDAPPPDGYGRAKLRARALAWLAGERDAWAKLIETGDRKARLEVVATLAALEGRPRPRRHPRRQRPREAPRGRAKGLAGALGGRRRPAQEGQVPVGSAIADHPQVMAPGRSAVADPTGTGRGQRDQDASAKPRAAAWGSSTATK